jgi:hypothetical protein
MKKTKSVKKQKPKKSKSKKIVILETKKRFEEIKENKNEITDDLEDEEDLDFSPGFRLTPVKRNLENIPVGNSLEGGLTFAPRVGDRNKGGKNYSENKYETKYNGSKYGEKTPDEYASVEPISKSSEESSNP